MYAENTRAQYYPEYTKQSKEQRLSFHIFNSHVKHFRDALVKFLEHAHLGGSYLKQNTLNPIEWYNFYFSKPAPYKEDACQNFLRYDYKGTQFVDEESPENETIYTNCVDELTKLIGEIEDFAEDVERKLAEQPDCGHVEHCHRDVHLN
jgi:hypothetical protein